MPHAYRALPASRCAFCCRAAGSPGMALARGWHRSRRKPGRRGSPCYQLVSEGLTKRSLEPVEVSGRHLLEPAEVGLTHQHIGIPIRAQADRRSRT
jgi:hypothetical protein